MIKKLPLPEIEKDEYVAELEAERDALRAERDALRYNTVPPETLAELSFNRGVGVGLERAAEIIRKNFHRCDEMIDAIRAEMSDDNQTVREDDLCRRIAELECDALKAELLTCHGQLLTCHGQLQDGKEYWLERAAEIVDNWNDTYAVKWQISFVQKIADAIRKEIK